MFAPIRDFYAMLPESRERGYKAGRFSFNVKGGRCEACQGDGLKRIEMNFLPDVYVTCDVCRGKRYNYETLQVKYKGHSHRRPAGDSTVEEALPVLETNPADSAEAADAARCRARVHASGAIVHHSFGRRSAAHQAGERVEQAADRADVLCARRADHRTCISRTCALLEVLQRLVDLGNTVVVIEHNLDVIKCADWVIDLGPDGGEGGGQDGRHGDARRGDEEHAELYGRGIAQDGEGSQCSLKSWRMRRLN